MVESVMYGEDLATILILSCRWRLSGVSSLELVGWTQQAGHALGRSRALQSAITERVAVPRRRELSWLTGSGLARRWVTGRPGGIETASPAARRAAGQPRDAGAVSERREMALTRRTRTRWACPDSDLMCVP